MSRLISHSLILDLVLEGVFSLTGFSLKIPEYEGGRVGPVYRVSSHTAVPSLYLGKNSFRRPRNILDYSRAEVAVAMREQRVRRARPPDPGIKEKAVSDGSEIFWISQESRLPWRQDCIW